MTKLKFLAKVEDYLERYDLFLINEVLDYYDCPILGD